MSLARRLARKKKKAEKKAQKKALSVTDVREHSPPRGRTHAAGARGYGPALSLGKIIEVGPAISAIEMATELWRPVNAPVSPGEGPT